MYDINGNPETMAGTEFFCKYIFVPYFGPRPPKKNGGLKYNNPSILVEEKKWRS